MKICDYTNATKLHEFSIVDDGGALISLRPTLDGVFTTYMRKAKMNDRTTGRLQGLDGFGTALATLLLALATGFAPNVTDAKSISECTTLWESSDAAEHCATPTYTDSAGELCMISTTCSVTADVISGITLSGSRIVDSTVTINSPCIGGTGCWWAGGIPQWTTANMDVCVRSLNDAYSIQFASGDCKSIWISAAKAVEYGIPSHTEWARRNREAAIGLINSFTEGTLPRYAYASQFCVDNWMNAPAVDHCTLTSTTNNRRAGGIRACDFFADCTVTADIYLNSDESLYAENVTLTNTTRGSEQDRMTLNWAESEVTALDICFSETSTGSQEPEFRMHLRSGCNSGETTADDAESTGLWAAATPPATGGTTIDLD